ncbi:MAG: hypothetical protein AB7T49_08985 [Oligoflexales bacterium]
MKSLFFSILMFLFSCNTESYEGRAYTKTDHTHAQVEPAAQQQSGDQTPGNEVATDDKQDEATDDTADDATDDQTPPPAAPPPADPNIVAFSIVAGTGTNAYNQKATPVTVKVGMTLRVTNNDTVAHRIHTGGAPFPHGEMIAPGATVDYPIAAAVDITNLNQPPTYDHISGQAAMFWIQANP